MKIEQNGQEIEVDQVFPVTENEPWNVYQLEDGTRLRMKTVAQQILKIRGKKDQYMVKSSNIVTVDSVSDN